MSLWESCLSSDLRHAPDAKIYILCIFSMQRHQVSMTTTEPTSAEEADVSTVVVPTKRQQSEPSVVLHSSTLRRPQWTYFHLAAFSTAAEEPPNDPITTRQNLSSALSKFLGLAGWSIPVDILKIQGTDIWVRVPRDNSRAFHEGVSAWVGQGQLKYIIKGKDDWLPKLSVGDGQDVF